MNSADSFGRLIERVGFTRTFAIASFLAILCISVVSGFYFHRYLSENMLERELVVSSEFLHGMAYRKDEVGEPTVHPHRLDSKARQRLVEGLLFLPNLISAKIYDVDKTIVWSTQTELIGSKDSYNDELDAALQGIAGYEVEHAERQIKDEHLSLPPGTNDFVESYIPIKDPHNGKVIGVVEIYRYPQALFDALREGEKIVVLVSALGGIILFLFLFWIVSNANRIILNQRDGLQAARTRAVSRNEHFLTRVGAELHDGPVQSIGFSLLKLDAITEASAKNKDVSEEVGKIRLSLQDAMAEIRNVSAGLSVPELDELDIDGAIELAVNRHRRRTNANVKLDLNTASVNAMQAVKVCVYRVVQEGLTNAYLHTNNSAVQVGAKITNGILHLSIADAGPGLPDDYVVDQPDHALGLAGLRERVESVGGRFEIRSNRYRGVELIALIPVGTPQIQ
ncbi:MAG: ATP-binding protein [bacterium]